MSGIGSFDLSGYTTGGTNEIHGEVVDDKDPLRAGRVRVKFLHDPDGATNLRWVYPLVAGQFSQTVNSAKGGKQGTGISPTHGPEIGAVVLCSSNDRGGEQLFVRGTLTSSNKEEGDTSGKNDVIPHAKEPQYSGGDFRYVRDDQRYDGKSLPNYGMREKQNNFGQQEAKEIESGKYFTLGRNTQYA